MNSPAIKQSNHYGKTVTIELSDSSEHRPLQDPLHTKCSVTSAVSSKDDDDDEQDLDSDWSWVVLASAFMISAILWGQVIAFNVYFMMLRQAFGESRSKTAWIGSLNQATINLTGIGAGFFLTRFGPRSCTMLGGIIASLGYVASFFATNANHLLITYGLIAGCGYGLCFTSCLAAVSQYFNRHFAIATSLSVTGGGLGIMFFGNLLEYLSNVYGLKGSLLIQGGITLHICVFAATFFPRSRIRRKSMATLLAESIPLMTMRERLVDWRVLILMSIGFLGGVALMAILVVYKDLASNRGLTHIFEMTMTVVGAGNIVGRFAPGIILKMQGVHPIRYLILTMATCSLALFAVAFAENPIIFIHVNGIIGCGQGNFVSAMPIIVGYIFGRREMAVTYGYMLFSTGIGLLIGGPFAGFLADYTGSYMGYLIFCGSLLSLATLLVVVLYFLHERRTGK